MFVQVIKKTPSTHLDFAKTIFPIFSSTCQDILDWDMVISCFLPFLTPLPVSRKRNRAGGPCVLLQQWAMIKGKRHSSHSHPRPCLPTPVSPPPTAPLAFSPGCHRLLHLEAARVDLWCWRHLQANKDTTLKRKKKGETTVLVTMKVLTPYGYTLALHGRNKAFKNLWERR